MTEQSTGVPEPTETGVAGTQVAAVDTSSPTEKPPLVQLELPGKMDAFDGLAANHSKALGAFGADALGAFLRYLSFTHGETKAELARTLAKFDAAQKEVTDLRVDKATLTTQLDAAKRNRVLTGGLSTIGTVLIGVGHKLFNDSQQVAGGIVFACGLALVLAGWLGLPRSRNVR